MGEFARWAILIAAFAVIIGLILSLPIFQSIDGAIGAISRGCSSVVSVAGSYIKEARGFLNMLVFPGVEPLVTVCAVWLLTKPFHKFLINGMILVYHWIFK